MEVTNSNITRKIRLSKIGCYQIKESEKELFNFIENSLMGLKAVELKDYPNFVMYFNNDNKNILQYKRNINRDSWLGVNNLDIWNIFQTQFYYCEKETKQLIKNIVGETYKLKNVNPVNLITYYTSKVENSYLLQILKM